jgi:hypothetical protein
MTQSANTVRLDKTPGEIMLGIKIRAALRCLPELARRRYPGDQAFWHWSADKRAEHVFALFMGCNVCLAAAFGERKLGASALVKGAWQASQDTRLHQALPEEHQELLDTVADEVVDAIDAYAANANALADAGYETALEQRIALAWAEAVPYPNLAEATAAAARDTSMFDTTLDYVNTEVIHDKALVLMSKLSATELLRLPLWHTPPPPEWNAWLGQFRADVIALGQGFGFWAEWIDAIFSDAPMDGPGLRAIIEIPESVKSQGLASIHAYLSQLLTVDESPTPKARNAGGGMIKTVQLSGFDPAGEPELHIMANDELRLVFNFMPPSNCEDGRAYETFDQVLSQAIGVAVEWEDREVFRIQSPKADTVQRIAAFVASYRKNSGR